MKKLNLIPIILVCVLVSAHIYGSDLRTNFENYKIEKPNDLYVGKVAHEAWTVKYGTGENPVTIVKCNSDNKCEYIVRSKFFAVCYANSNKGFGARTAKGSLNNVPEIINNAVINASQMKNQQIISPQLVDNEKALSLIASYLPDLINDNYKQVLN